MKNPIPAILAVFVILAIAIPATMWGWVAMEEEQTTQIEAETAKIQKEIESNNAQWARAKDAIYTGLLVVAVALNNGLLIGGIVYLAITRKRDNDKLLGMMEKKDIRQTEQLSSFIGCIRRSIDQIGEMIVKVEKW